MTQPVSLAQAARRGFTMRCPNCGKGHLFRRFLKVVDHCEVCGEDYTPQRADGFPAYLVIVVVGHVIVPALLAVEIAYAPPAWLQLAIWLPARRCSRRSRCFGRRKARSSACSGKPECMTFAESKNRRSAEFREINRGRQHRVA